MHYNSLFTDTLYDLQVVFAPGVVTAGQTECQTESVDNNILDWVWELTVSLKLSSDNQPIILGEPDTFTLTVMDDEGMFFF